VTVTRYALVHPEMGIYLGSAMGLGFWSKLDPVGQPAAVTFDSEQQAHDVVKTWDAPVTGYTLHAVEIAYGVYATVDECVRAGLPKWNPWDQRSTR